MKKILAVLIMLMGFCGISFAAENAIQVTQPAYHNMKFYVYKPVNLPKEYYVTYDGYLVYRDEKGVWNYGSAEKAGITKTGYVVGSVIPSVVKLKPYNVKISSVAPLYTSQPRVQTSQPQAQTESQPKYPRIVYMPPASGLELYTPSELSPNNPDWTQNSNFMAIGKWQNSIDRIGVINRPMMPVAWKGEFPEVIYAWTGLQWKQIEPKTSNTKAISTLRREIYNLSRYARKVNMLHWTDDDSHVLSQYSVMWGYEWMGLIILQKEY